jgi:xanthine dehydrogenase accessory factor
MDSTDLVVLRKSVEWLQAGHRLALATVVQTWGSAPRPLGSWLVIREDGQVIGSISGGCLEDDLIRRVRSDILAQTAPQVVTYGVTKDEAARFGLPCGGTMRIVVEPQPDLALLQALLQRILDKRLTVRELDLPSGKSLLRDASRADVVSFDGQVMRTVYGPRWRLVVVGAGQLSQYVCQFALAADYEVVVVDPREEFTEGLAMAGVDFRRGMPDDVILEIGVDNHTAVLALTHDPKLDDMALLEALKSSAFYVGALGSRTSTARRRERLALFDLSAGEIDRLYGPVGLFIGAETPPEMALSIMAEVTAAKHQVPILQKRQIASAELSTRHESIEALSAPSPR